ncbi:unnamed protein product [[Actinomadura] parvosata subsp. kistnae]|nr:unnamed protein product [Actinomadura parvosata subsp. kistnae]
MEFARPQPLPSRVRNVPLRLKGQPPHPTTNPEHKPDLVQ